MSVGFAAATAAEVCATLERAVQSRGGAPLVLMHDNGPGYAAQTTRSWRANRGVLQLFSLPRTPQHNAIAERGMRDLKEDSGLGRELVRDMVEIRERLVRSIERLEAQRPRASKGWRTLWKVDAALPSWRGWIDRWAIYEAATCAMEEAVLDSMNGRERRRAIREAILSSLERFHVITRTRER